MSKSPKSSRTSSRPSVDAIQYEKLALSAFERIERHSAQLEKLLTLATSIYQNPAITVDERHRQRTLLGLWIETGEDYRREVETDRELYGIIALDAKGVPQMHLTAHHATKLLTKAAHLASANNDDVCVTGSIPTKRARAKTSSRRSASRTEIGPRHLCRDGRTAIMNRTRKHERAPDHGCPNHVNTPFLHRHFSTAISPADCV